MMPPISSFEMEMPERLPSSTVSAEGGISMSTAPIAMSGPVAIVGWYPRASITGSIRLPSIAVVAMVEPEIAENTVPATTATTASRPGTWRIRCSTPSITFTASPVWNSTSPMRMKSGMGVSEKLATDPTELRANWTSPASPPRNSHAPSRLITRNENATGRPRNSSAVEPPSISHAAASHGMALSGRDPVVARRALGECQAAHAEQHLDGECEESDRQHAEQPPLRRHQRLDGHRARLEAGDRGAGAVVGDEEARGETQDVHHPLEGPADPIRHCAQDDVHPDVLPAPKQPRRGKHGDEVERAFRDLVAPLEPGDARDDAHVAQQHIGADHQRHAEHQRACGEGERLEKFAVRRLEPIHGYFASTFCNWGPYTGLALMAFAHPISFDFSTNALLVAASKAITWMPASAWRLASCWL